MTICKKCNKQKSVVTKEQVMGISPIELCMCPKSAGKYKTYSLNEAVYFILKGLSYEVGDVASVHSNFIFEQTAELEKFRKEFWTRSCKVNIHQWLACRNEVKTCLRAQVNLHISRPISEKSLKAIRNKVLQVPVIPFGFFTPKNGDVYWFEQSGVPMQATFGANVLHHMRLKDYNCFKLKADCEAYIARKTV